MVTYITAQYRHVVVCSGLYPVRSQSLHGGYSSGCIESAMQPSFTEKSSRTTLHYVIRNDSARDLVLPPLASCCTNQSSYVFIIHDVIPFNRMNFMASSSVPSLKSGWEY